MKKTIKLNMLKTATIFADDTFERNPPFPWCMVSIEKSPMLTANHMPKKGAT